MSELKAPSADFATFSEKGYSFAAKLPAGPAERSEFAVTVSREQDAKPLFSYTVPMLYAPVFGVDGGDRAALEQATDQVITLLPSADEFSTELVATLGADPALQQARVVVHPAKS